MAQRVIQTSKRLAAERQIHAAIAHFYAGDYECVVSLCSAAEGQIPEPSRPLFHLFRRLRKHAPEDDFNYVANWMKHDTGPAEVKIEEWQVTFWLNRAISKYRSAYGIGTPEMADLFPWAGRSLRPGEPA